MTILSDRSIINHMSDRRIGINPYPASGAIQPASVDLRLDDDFKYMDGSPVPGRGGRWELNRNQFFLGSTIERVRVPDHLVARVEGKSSLGRMGILVHATAGFIDPGFEGTITLEFTNLSDQTFPLRPGMYICQISFEYLDFPAERPYGHHELKSNYHGQSGTKRSKYASQES